MKRSVKHFFIILVLISWIVGAIDVTPVHAASSMQVVTAPLPPGWQSGFLYGVWGTSANDIYAVGYGNNGVADTPLIYHKDASNWTSYGLGLPQGWNTGYLFGVWGSSASDVYAVGFGYNGSTIAPLVYQWNGSNWSALSFSLPDGVTSGSLSGIWGSGANDIYVVGYGFSQGSIVPLMYHKNIMGWSLSTVSLPAEWSSVNFKGMWGSGLSNAYAVGTGVNGGTNRPLVYSKSGSTWSVAGLSLPSGTSSGYLSGIWGASVSDVYAVGYAYSGSTAVPLMYHRDSSTWTETSPGIPGGWSSGFLYGVWGSGTDDVYAVGSGNNGSILAPLVYYKNSTGWTEISPLPPVGWTSGSLFSVWGSGSSDVYAVGSGNNGVTTVPLIYRSSQGGQDSLAPGDVTGFAASTGATNGTVNLSWTAPADDDGGSVAAYLVKYSTSPFTSWNNGTAITTGLPAPGSPGTAQSMTVSGLVPHTLYYFAIRAQDEQYNLSTNYVAASATAQSGSQIPGQVTQVVPSGSINSNRPTYTWTADNTATWYHLWVDGPSGNVIQQWYTSAQANCNGSTCSVTPATILSSGAHTWWVRTWNGAGNGPWSAGMNFNVPAPSGLGGATLVSPTGSINNNTPVYTWNQVSGAAWYYLWVNGPNGNVIKQWYTSAQANCNGSTCSVTPTTALGSGSHTWWIQTYNAAGYGQWSAAMSFTPTPPGGATLVSPTGGINNNTPAYTWNQVSDASWYYLWVDGPSGNVIQQWYSSVQANCNGSTCTVTPTTTLGSGSHTWRIQTWNDAGYGPWSDSMSFESP